MSAAISFPKVITTFLGPPLTDGDDALKWISSQSWSNGKVGTIGCSSTAEWQLAVAAQGNPAFAAMIPQGFGAGVGARRRILRAGEMVSRRRGADALSSRGSTASRNQVRPTFPPNARRRI
jgi:hypothetical protein